MKTHIEIKAENLLHNIEEFRKLTKDKKIVLAVKGNAYGHGLKEIVSITRRTDIVDYYAVDTLEEALITRSVDTKKNILVIGWADIPERKEIIKNGFELVIPSVEYLEETEALASESGVQAKVHLKVETGTSRMGMLPEEIIQVMNGTEFTHSRITGLYSHFANIEDTTDHSYARFQLGVFNNLIKSLGPLSDGLLKHFSCSAAALLFPSTYFDIIRIGISAYGFWPSKPTYVSYMAGSQPEVRLKPVLSWKTKVAQVKQLEKGAPIGYGLTYRVFDRATMIVVPVGYYDGYDRGLSGTATIIVNGVKAPVRGRVCMNMFMAEITHIPGVKAGDPVILIGSNGDETISADHLAEICGTINYEMVSRINPLIPRVVV